MMFKNFPAQVCTVNMNIYLGSGYAFMAQHLLDGTQVGPAFKQMGRERVTQCVR